MNPNSDMAEADWHSEVTSAFEALVDSAQSLDLDRYFSLFDKPRFTALNANGTVVHGFEEFEAVYREQIQVVERYNSLSFEKVRLTLLTADVCILVNEYSAELVLKSGDVVSATGAGTQVWCKASGAWLLTHISSSDRSGEMETQK